MEATQAFGTILTDLWGGFSLVLMAVVGLVVIVWDAFSNDSKAVPWVAAAALAVGIVWEAAHLNVASQAIFSGMIRSGGVASFVNIIVMLCGLFSIVLSIPYLRSIRHPYGEVYALILFATVGMILLGTANNLVSVFVGLETMSICLYILTGLVRDDEGAIESALKYFLLGAFSTGFFLYGIALIYAAAGTMSLPDIGAGLQASHLYVLFWAGVGLLLIGFLFKVSAVPFHMWTPDVYQGAPTTLTGYMSTASKAAAFASLILILYYALPPERWSLVLAVIAVITMVLGNVLALAQSNVKRMLAYSSIAHAGYVLVGLAAGTAAGYSGALIYLLFYAFMNIGAFGVMALLEWDQREGRVQTLDSLAGVGHRQPLLGVAMGVFMFSLTGFPPFGGFFGKFAVFAPAIDAGLTWLVIVGLLASAVSAAYYLRVLWVFWMKPAAEEPAEARTAVFSVPASAAAVIVACAVLLIVLGFVPGLYDVTQSFFLHPVAATAALP
ncbi:MAG TPA: NADH-quinone oxidoreductase subunit N [Rhodothermales bacterium]|nr:NADH-quinone oxidoreductase subunit N [Rhodothermales bacterium]